MNTFGDMQLVKIAGMKKGEIMRKLNTYSVRDCLLFHRRLTESIAGFTKRNKHLLSIQWELVCVAEMIRRTVWQAIYDDYKIQIKISYPKIASGDLKRITKGKTEGLIKRYSY